MANNISAWNAKIDNTLTVLERGRNGILYEYVLPYGANPMNYYKEAIDVKSHKGDNRNPSTAKRHEGQVYRSGEYQPIGDKRYFTYYQIRKMLQKNDWEKFLQDVERRKQFRLVKLISDSVYKVMFNE